MPAKVFEKPFGFAKVIISAAVACLEVLGLSLELLTKLTIVNAKDSLCIKMQNFRPIVEFPGEALG